MIEEAKLVLQLLQKKGFEAYYIGGKCRVEIHNKLHPSEKIAMKDIDIVTNAPNDKIKEIFPSSNERGEAFKVVAVKFGGIEFEVATYRKDIYDMEAVAKSDKILNPEVEAAQSLDEDRARRDFTINTVAEDIEGNYIDYTYIYKNKKISALKDIADGIIRAVGNPKCRFEEDPIRIIRMFRFLAQTGYDIETNTLKSAISCIKLMEKIPHERFGPEFNKLIAGRYASKALQMMREIGVFKLNITNSISGKQTQLLPGLNELTNEHISILDIFNSKNKGNATLELWTLLLRSLGKDKAKENLESFYPVSKDEIECIEWMIDNFMIIESEDIRSSIFEARTGIVARFKLPCMKDLLKRIGNIHVTLYNDEDHKNKYRLMIDAFCMRPYFHEQLKVTGDQIMEIAGEGPGPWINDVKERLLKKLIHTKKFPKEEDYMVLVNEAIEETLIEKEFKAAGIE